MTPVTHATSERAHAASKVRQRFTVALGWAGVAVGIAMMCGAWGGHDRLNLAASGFALAVASYTTMARPFLAVEANGLRVSNVLRESLIGWDGIHHTTSRGSLVIHTNDGRKTTVWAISSQRAGMRTRHDDDPRGRLRPASPEDLVAPTTSALALKEAINAETVDNPEDSPTNVVTRWLPVPCVLLAVALCGILAAMVL